MTPKANIFDIQGLSVHDGPGNRSMIFLQGCSLNCKWCSNPEGISKSPSLLYNAEKCRLDGNCVADCEFDAISIKEDQLLINRELCKKCTDHNCLTNCYTKALSISSQEMGVEQLMKIIQRDRQYWGQDGGITLSGGEPLLQIDFVEELLEQCHDSYIHTAIETCGNMPWKNFERTLPYLDWIFYDLKHCDTELHKQQTGSSNSLILDNLKLLSKRFEGRLIVRIPLIPGFNNTEKAMQQYASFFSENNIREVNLLPLHHLGREKYPLLGLNYSMDETLLVSKQEVRQFSDFIKSRSIKCYSADATPF